MIEKNINIQVTNIEEALKWLKTCPFQYAISSMQGGFLHIKIFVPTDKFINEEK
jgi:hypothetical protein|tara:strand:+ start:600 stop:761 length:162 start_codon:yes stop_codon:yes gene_type:complete